MTTDRPLRVLVADHEQLLRETLARLVGGRLISETQFKTKALRGMDAKRRCHSPPAPPLWAWPCAVANSTTRW
ncbi:hypothetical protein [Streptomyces sviceus]|uniref:hypothetical protein n=1 Tax=Streptomyces sviceus TaxID=285530 RepID=UPI0036CE7281